MAAFTLAIIAYRGDRTAAQREFFSAIRRRTPEVLESFRAKILPVIKKICDEGSVGKKFVTVMYPLIWDWSAQHHLVTGDRVMPLAETSRGLSKSEIKAKRASFQDSAEQTFFFPFALWAILGTLAVWHEDANSAGLDWDLPYWPYPIEDCSEILRLRTLDSEFEISDLFTPPNKTVRVPFRFQCTAWNSLQETRAAAKKRILAQFTQALDQQLDQAEKLQRLFGVPVAPAKISTDHFDWLVLYQVCQQPFGQIAKGDPTNRDPQAVTDGVKDAAKRVIGPGWKRWLRSPKPGRPKAI